MALVLNDRVKETSTTTGTGTLNLDGAVQDFEDAGRRHVRLGGQGDQHLDEGGGGDQEDEEEVLLVGGVHGSA